MEKHRNTDKKRRQNVDQYGINVKVTKYLFHVHKKLFYQPLWDIKYIDFNMTLVYSILVSNCHEHKKVYLT